ncbi:hypothetical protein M9H77_23550 [Catharanthus roseus]|uniref:Uncharacterized protein n=1 Tax=Catharanthus roseus TaxID=4058 RepID=A0ACC0AT82_CATRO|nr:hypothetical protein M9H77_23550 [Catharanthus roseus]
MLTPTRAGFLGSPFQPCSWPGWPDCGVGILLFPGQRLGWMRDLLHEERVELRRKPISYLRLKTVSGSKRSRAKQEGRRRSSEARGKERRMQTSNESSVQLALEELKAKQRLFTSSTMSK